MPSVLAVMNTVPSVAVEKTKRAVGAGGRAGFMQAVMVPQEVAVLAERIPVDLAGVEVNQPVRVGVLELQNGFLESSRHSADLNGEVYDL